MLLYQEEKAGKESRKESREETCKEGSQEKKEINCSYFRLRQGTIVLWSSPQPEPYLVIRGYEARRMRHEGRHILF
jgi:hypothetical protein